MRFDLEGLAPEPRQIIEGALAACTYPFADHGGDVVVPVEFADLSRFLRQRVVDVRGGGEHVHSSPAGQDPGLPEFGHLHVHGEDGELGHGIVFRQRALGLYWLPTPTFPAGRISVEATLDEALAREVFLCEAAHAIDYVAMSDGQREAILRAYHTNDPGLLGHVHDWFEEGGEQDYRDWTGESFMIGFVRAYSPIDVRFDQFSHQSTPEVVRAIREILTPAPPPPPPPVFVGFPRRHVYHRPACPVVRFRPGRARPLEDLTGRRPCRICKPAAGS